MFDITLYLSRFKKLVTGNQETKDVVKNIFQSTLNISLSDTQIVLKGKSLLININPATKSLFFMRKRQLLEALKNNPKTSFIDRID